MHSAKILLATLFVIFALAVTPSLVLADQGSAETAISSARSTILSCYNAANEAEAAGANITGLTDKLNEAGSLLSNAELDFSKNDFDGALNSAVQSQTVLVNFVSEANTLKETAGQQQAMGFRIDVVVSVAGAFAVIGAGAGSWFFLKRKHEKNGGKAAGS